MPDWQAVAARDYQPWTRDRVIVDSAGLSIAACVARIRAAL